MLSIKSFTFEAAHRLPSHEGDCQFVHGHSYKVEVAFQDSLIHPRLANGMVKDFQDIKMIVKSLIGHWDHALILNHTDPLLTLNLQPYAKVVVFPGEPTAENMAEFIGTNLIEDGWNVPFVKVWETATAYAIWRS